MKKHEVEVNQDQPNKVRAKHGEGMYLEMLDLVKEFNPDQVTRVDCIIQGSQLCPVRIHFTDRDGKRKVVGSKRPAETVLTFIP